MPIPLPAAIKRPFRAGHRRFMFRRAIRRVLMDPLSAVTDERTMKALVYGWGNEGWSADSRYLAECARQALVTEGPVVECGSGLTTLVVGAIAQQRGFELWTLEHHGEWAERVQSQLDRFGINAVRICSAPLINHGEFDWYHAPVERMPSFSMVICDGPPSTTRGGRYGLTRVLKDRLNPGCVILLDDAVRADEREIATRWANETGATQVTEGPYVRVTLPQ